MTIRGETLMDQGFAVVVDIGKTLSKITLWSRDGRMIDKTSRPNAKIGIAGVPRLDEQGIRAFIDETLARFAGQPIEYIVPVAHGAAFAAIADGVLAYPPIDYEAEAPDEVIADYRAVRPPFEETGSPALPACLNLGLQLFWAESLYPALFSSPSLSLVPWAQYWAWYLSGEACSEASSLGCHTDIWNPSAGRFSSMAVARGWSDRFAALCRADEPVGTLRPDLANRTGLPANVRVLAGLHDSNAALWAARGFAEIEDREATVLSTGTWFIAMRLAQAPVDIGALSEERDCLVNVDPTGRPIPSARFMGGREIERLVQIDTRRVDIKPDQPRLLAAIPQLLETSAMVMPTLAPGNGPFPDGEGGWVDRPDDWFARRAAACLYAALVAETSLALVGSKGRLLVEGRFAEAEVFVRALASLRPDLDVFVANAHNDVSFGALRLIDPELRPSGDLRRIEPLPHDLSAYAGAWTRRIEYSR